jgi:putative ABC transport system substrate-binding protein
MRRRVFLSVIAGATAWSLGARAQQPAMPVVGAVTPVPWDAASHLLAAFRRGLAEAGYVEGKNLSRSKPASPSTDQSYWPRLCAMWFISK